MTHRRRLGVLATAVAGLVSVTIPATAASTPSTHHPSIAQIVGAYPGEDLSLAIRNYLAGQRDTQPPARARMVPGGGVGRPTYGSAPATSMCQDVCVHYATSGTNAATTPWAKTTLNTLDHVYEEYAAAGYRHPEADTAASDDANNPNGKIDIYLVDFKTYEGGVYDGYYGYCAPANASDQSSKPAQADDSSAFCVLDNDYAKSQYPARTPLQNLRVTAAHEFFHAVQFAYDWLEDDWFMEGTATWAEDEVYTGINDNRQYLPFGPLGRPAQPMDLGDIDSYGNDNYGVYGDWLFFRYLSERFPAKTGDLPTIVRKFWEAADSTGRTDRYSVQAISSVLRARGTSLQQQWGRFIDANRHPVVSYSEGRAYRTAAPAGTTRLRAHSGTATGAFRVDHLAAATERLVPSRLVRGTRLRLKVTTARPGISDATVSVWLKNGRVTSTPIRLTRRTGQVTIPFAASAVNRAELTVGNAAALYRCHTGRDYSCQGTPLRDNLRLAWSAQVLKP